MVARNFAKRGVRILLVVVAVAVVTLFYRVTAFANHTTVALTFLVILLADLTAATTIAQANDSDDSIA